MVSCANSEEQASDVNIAAHLLLDVLSGHIDAALVSSNDCDLRFPVKRARLRVPKQARRRRARPARTGQQDMR